MTVGICGSVIGGISSNRLIIHIPRIHRKGQFAILRVGGRNSCLVRDGASHLNVQFFKTGKTGAIFRRNNLNNRLDLRAVSKRIGQNHRNIQITKDFQFRHLCISNGNLTVIHDLSDQHRRIRYRACFSSHR